MEGALKRDVEALLVDPDDIRPMENQPRIFFDDAEIESLRESISIEQEQDVHVIRIPGAKSKPHFEINDGERRWRAALKDGTKLKVIVDPPESAIKRFERAVRSNVKVELSPYEKMLACARLSNEGGHSPQEIARRTAINRVTVQLYLQIVRDLHPDVLALLRPDRAPGERLRVMVAYQLSRYNHGEQKRMAPHMLGMGERQANAFIRVRGRAGLTQPKQAARGKRRPSDDYYTFAAALKRARRDVGNYVEMDRFFFLTMLANREPADVKKNLADIDATIKALNKIKEKVQKARDGK